MLELTRKEVELWIKTMATGEFHYTKVLDGNVAKPSYNKLRKIMFDLVKAGGVCEPIGKHDGYYRPIQDLPQPISLIGVGSKVGFPIDLPFGLREYVFIYPNTTIIAAGEKSAGKTGFLYRTVAMNINKPYQVILLSNMEGGREQMRDRFAAMGLDVDALPFLIFEAKSDFHDFIRYPNTLYVIDYIDVPDGMEFYLIASAIHKVQTKLDNSVAVIGLQKPAGRDTAYGGEPTMRDATLYLALNKGRLKIVDAKVPADPTIIPRNMLFSFDYADEGCSFTNIRQVYES